MPTPERDRFRFANAAGVSAWPENIRVPGSHCGMTHNPFILHVIAERLARREHAWKPFRASLATRLFLRPIRAKDALRSK